MKWKGIKLKDVAEPINQTDGFSVFLQDSPEMELDGLYGCVMVVIMTPYFSKRHFYLFFFWLTGTPDFIYIFYSVVLPFLTLFSCVVVVVVARVVQELRPSLCIPQKTTCLLTS